LKLEEIFQEVKAQNSFLFLDMMEFHPTRPEGLLLPLFHYAGAVHCNQREAMVNTGKDNPEEAVKEILRRGAKAVFLTRGGTGAELITQELCIVQPGFTVDAVDATGAGDAFCAGVVYQLLGLDGFEDIGRLSNDTLVEVLMMGQAVGASAATKAGCVEGVDRDKVDQIISQQKEDILNGTLANRYFVG
jgi:fructokinase